MARLTDDDVEAIYESSKKELFETFLARAKLDMEKEKNIYLQAIKKARDKYYANKLKVDQFEINQWIANKLPKGKKKLKREKQIEEKDHTQLFESRKKLDDLAKLNEKKMEILEKRLAKEIQKAKNKNRWEIEHRSQIIKLILWKTRIKRWYHKVYDPLYALYRRTKVKIVTYYDKYLSPTVAVIVKYYKVMNGLK